MTIQPIKTYLCSCCQERYLDEWRANDCCPPIHGYVCPECDGWFRLMKDFQAHVKSEHTETK